VGTHHGRQLVLTNDISARRTLIGRLRNCELAIDDSGESWRTAGTFPETM
jgi:hypothetical protein